MWWLSVGFRFTFYYHACRALEEYLEEVSSPLQIGWICPEQTSGTRIMGNVSEVTEYVGCAIRKSTRAGDENIFAPCFERWCQIHLFYFQVYMLYLPNYWFVCLLWMYGRSYHWCLIVLCVNSNTIFFFDSIRPKKQQRKLLVNSIFNG